MYISLENKGEITENHQPFDLSDFMCSQALYFNSLRICFRYCLVFFCHLRFYHHYDLSGDAEYLFDFTDCAIKYKFDDSTISIFKDLLNNWIITCTLQGHGRRATLLVNLSYLSLLVLELGLFGTSEHYSDSRF